MVLESWKIKALRGFRLLELTHCLVRRDIYNRWYLTVNQLMLVKTAWSSTEIVNMASLTSTGKWWHVWHMSSDHHPMTVSENGIKGIPLLVIDPSPRKGRYQWQVPSEGYPGKRKDGVKGIKFIETDPSPSKGWHERQVSPTVGIKKKKRKNSRSAGGEKWQKTDTRTRIVLLDSAKILKEFSSLNSKKKVSIFLSHRQRIVQKEKVENFTLR